MKRALPFVAVVLCSLNAMAQEPVFVNIEKTISVPTGHSTDSVEALRGDKVEFDTYFSRATALNFYTMDVKILNQLVRYAPTGSNPFYKSVGSYFPFSGDARVLGVRIAYAVHVKNEGDDTYDLSLYHVSEKGTDVLDEILAVKSFYGNEITTGSPKDSFTYIQFKSNDFTTVSNGFAVMVALEDVTPFADSLDVVGIYTSAQGDGRKEHRAMVRLTPESILWDGQTEYKQMDRLIRDPSTGYFEFDFDVIMIPVMDVEAGVGYINMNGVKFNGHFPNPAKDQITIDLDVNEAQENFEISVQTMGGQIIKTVNTGFLFEGKQLINLDISDLAAGNYVYTIQSDKAAITNMLVVTE